MLVNVPRPRRLDDLDHSSSICTKSGAATEAHIGARLGATPEEMLFADHSANSVAGAERVGLGGHVYVNADTLAEIMRAGRIAGIKRIDPRLAIGGRRSIDRRRFQRRARGGRFGHLTIRRGQNSGARSLSLAETRPRTETPASCTLSGEPETSGCQSCRSRPSATSR